MKTTKKKPTHAASLPVRQVLVTWLPLVASWLLMSLEIPTLNAIIARLPDAEINLAAYGSVVNSLAVAIDSPVIMMLAASTALSRDWNSYRKLRKYTVILGGALSLLQLIIVVTPIYDFIVNVLLHVPPELVEPGRIGLACLVPWSLGIGYRRFQQGAMIRYGHSGMVWETTIVRLVTAAVILTIGMVVKTIPGTLVGGLAQGLGVCAEAIYAGLRIRKVIPEIKAAPAAESELKLKGFIKFYIPLALTASMWLFWQPIASAAISRMPNPLESLAVWSVISGLLFVFRSAGLAYNEAVVSLMDIPNAFPTLRRFTRVAALVVTTIIVLLVVTPVSELWFSVVTNLDMEKVVIARVAMGLAIPLGFLSIYISYFQGIIVNQGKTNAIAEAVTLFLVGLCIVLVLGVVFEPFVGVYVASAAYSIAHLVQALWLMVRSRKTRKHLSLEVVCCAAGSVSPD